MKVEQLYSYQDIAELLSVSLNTVRKYIAVHNLNCVKLSSRTVRFRESEVLKLLSAEKDS